MTDKKLRRYQKRCLEAYTKWIATDIGESVSDRLASVVLPTGTGKTFSAASCIQSEYAKGKKLKVLWAAHREELITQAKDELTSIIPDIDIQVEMAENRAVHDADIVVGSVQTLHRDRKNMKGFEPDLIVIDEWHHYHEGNKQYHGLIEKYPKARVLGLTATPFRFSGGDLPLGKKLIEMDIGTAIDNNYLVPPKPEILKSSVSLAGVKSRAGDFAIDDLSKAVNVKDRNWMIAKRILSAVQDEDRQGILFAVDVQHSKAMAEMLRKGGVRVGEVYGETPKEERRDLMEKVRNKEIDVLCNNLVATEGFDVPHFDFVCIARPTKSLGLYIQMLGRGLRLAINKGDCLVIDVFDKTKVTQGVATYSKVAALGDIDGSRKRIKAIMKEPVSDVLDNFPVTIKVKRDQAWSIDNISWFAPAWSLDTNQWVVTWSKRSERKETDSYTWSDLKFTPSRKSLKANPIQVRHADHGEGVVSDIIYGTPHFLVVAFKDGIKNVTITSVKGRIKQYEKVNLDKSIQRAFYIVTNDDKTYCRVIALLKEDESFSILTDIKGDKGTVDEVIKSFAKEDDLVQVVKADAAWRKRDASDKQKSYISKMIGWGKVNSDIDVSSLTGGNASTVLEQSDWKDAINQIFGATTKEELIGYDPDGEDV